MSGAIREAISKSGKANVIELDGRGRVVRDERR